MCIYIYICGGSDTLNSFGIVHSCLANSLAWFPSSIINHLYKFVVRSLLRLDLGLTFSPWINLLRKQREHPMFFFQCLDFWTTDPSSKIQRGETYLPLDFWPPKPMARLRGLQQHTQKSIATSIDTTKNGYGWYTQDFAWQKSCQPMPAPEFVNLAPSSSWKPPTRHHHRNPLDLSKWHPAKAVTIQWNA